MLPRISNKKINAIMITKSIMTIVQGIAGLPLSSASLFLDRPDDPLFYDDLVRE
jgi:hypothetical protein